MPLSKTATASIVERVNQLDWNALNKSLFACGFAMTPVVLSRAECDEIASMFDSDELYRKTINMSQKNYGSGFYKYFKYPLPEPIGELRTAIYKHVAPIANEFHEALGIDQSFPATHWKLIEECHAVGQQRPTPLLLHYEQGDFNCMHQDVYGALTFPLQVTGFLKEAGTDFEGGEFLIQEQSYRMQSRMHVLKPLQGQLLVFTTRYRPEKTARGFRRVNVKHGVATVESGKRDTLGIIFHDAE